MAAIITDQLRIVNASNFVSGVQSSANSYYAFIGLPNAGSYTSTWDSDPPAPKDAFSQSDDYYDTMLVYIESILKQITNRTYQIKNAIDWRKFTSGAI